MATSSRRLRIPHPSLRNAQRTYLTSDYSSGTTLTVENNEQFAAQSIAIIGQPGTEKSEADSIDSVTGQTTITLDNGFNFSHNSGEIIYRSEFNQIEISVDTGSGWTVLATVDIQWDHTETVYIHEGGVDSNSYRFRFYNSASTNYSEYSSTIAGSGFTKFQVGRMVKNVRDISDRDGNVVSDIEIMRFLTQAKDIIRGRRADWWFWKRTDEGTISTLASTNKYDLDDIGTNIDYIDTVRFRNTSSGDRIYPLKRITDFEFFDLVRDNNRQDDDNVSIYRFIPPDGVSESGYIQVYPTPANAGNGSFYIDYYINESDYNSVSDTTSIPLSNILEDYAISQVEQLKGNESKAKVYRDLFFGPSQDRRDNEREMTGIALLEQMQKGKKRSQGKPHVLKRFLGRNMNSRYYRHHYARSLSDRENYY